ncbi:HNH endonuclease [Synechococcus sp. CCY9201]|uniref:HNH endonuclease n=1 Tax=Synechococcus sp. CCY9201 TaxID=174697 RepID=UPI002B1FCA6D|nr:HNH endonuclease [Synechococcus sp. CCY9201]MEA5475375.1 HNH endonuclease [Synechococcus sp. CCY9201]
MPFTRAATIKRIFVNTCLRAGDGQRYAAKGNASHLMSISNFFTNTLGANLSNPRWSWGASNPQTNQLFLRVWYDELETVDGVERSLILKTDRSYSSPGYPERQRHVEALRNGAQGYGVVCTAKDIHASGRTIKHFDRELLLQFGDIIDDGPSVFAVVMSRVPANELARPKSAASSVVPDLKSILNRRGGVTEKETLANARVGQGAFRADVLRIWDSRCCVTGSQLLDAIRASHVKPWRDSTNTERLDPNNGLPLIATIDALFDAGLVIFSADGKLKVARCINDVERELLGLADLGLSRTPNRALAEYLLYHRETVFLDAK